jgi:hypothetical protein
MVYNRGLKFKNLCFTFPAAGGPQIIKGLYLADP